MHKSRSNRYRNRTRRQRAAQRQAPLPLAVQRERAEDRLAGREAEWASQGFNSPSYNDKPGRKGIRRKMYSLADDVMTVLRHLMGRAA